MNQAQVDRLVRAIEKLDACVKMLDEEINPWQKHYLMFPKRIKGKWYCYTTVYRKFVLSPGGGFWQYGDVFDYLGWKK